MWIEVQKNTLINMDRVSIVMVNGVHLQFFDNQSNVVLDTPAATHEEAIGEFQGIKGQLGVPGSEI